MSHTPGPWRMGANYSVVADAPAPGVEGSDDIYHYGGHLIAESINEPNARLIAAAPDLLAALKWFVDDLTAPHSKMIDFDANLVRARAAIAKAEGDTP